MKKLLIGRWQPFHLGHLKLARDASKSSEKIMIAIGSAQSSHSVTNPFTCGERIEMIESCLSAEGISNFMVIPIPDIGNDALWVRWVETLCPKFDAVVTGNAWTSRLFREAGYKVETPDFLKKDEYNATKIRELMLKGKGWEKFVHPKVAEYIKKIDGIKRMSEISNKEDKKMNCQGPLQS